MPTRADGVELVLMALNSCPFFLLSSFFFFTFFFLSFLCFFPISLLYL
jgi:cell division protein FtsL